MQTPRRYAPLGGSFAPVRVAAFKWNGWQASAVYAIWRLALCLASAVVVNAGGRPSDLRVEIMSYNQYLGADLLPLFAGEPEEFNAALLGVLRQVADNKFPERARAQARVIMKRKPLLIGLQEVWSFACVEVQPGGEACQDPSIAGAFVDQLDETLSALEEQGGNYRAVAVVTNLNQTAPGIPFSVDDSAPFPQAFLQFKDRDVILAQEDVAATPVDYTGFGSLGICLKPSSDGCNFQTVASTDTPFGSLAIERGFVAVDAIVGEQTFRFTNTHLEVEQLGDDPASAFFQAAQAKELIDTLMITTPPQNTLLLVGDINSSPDAEPVPGLPFPPPYQQFLSAGYTDIWNLRPGNSEGYTCCQAADLSNRKSELGQRYDVLFALFPPDRAKKVRVLGAKVSDRLQPPGQGLWPSDHAAVGAELQYR